MNVLYLSPRPPDPPNKGDKIRSHHLARRLAARHRVHLGFLLDDETDAAGARAASGWAASAHGHPLAGWKRAAAGASCALRGRPLSTGWFRSAALARDVRRILDRESIDVAVAYCSSMAPYVEGFRGARVLDLVDVDSEKWRQYADRASFPKSAVFAAEHRLLRRYETRVVPRFERTVVISTAERETLARFADVSRVHVVANGVDADAWERKEPAPEGMDLVFVGALDYFANVDGVAHFAQDVFPRVRRRVPAARLKVVGRRPSPAVTALALIDGVDVVGEVDDARPSVWGAAVAIVPLRIAQGLQNKVLEAMAAGTPVVATPAAVRGIEGNAGEHYLVGQGDEELADAAVGLLENRAEGRAMAARARTLVESRYSWDQAARAFETILEDAVRTRQLRDGR
jgi:sugar transferase (PEP-CTERM/EpsH1 system associated)